MALAQALPGRRNGHAKPVPARQAEPERTGRPRDLIWDALAGIFGEPSTRSEREARNKNCKDFKTELERLGLSEAEQAARIWEAHENYAERMGDATETPFALAKHLTALVRPVAPRGPRVRREVVQRVTQYASKRVERSFSELIDDAEREAGG
jgi:hypothetical protein